MGDDEEDRKRLKEKLKQALEEADSRGRGPAGVSDAHAHANARTGTHGQACTLASTRTKAHACTPTRRP